MVFKNHQVLETHLSGYLSIKGHTLFQVSVDCKNQLLRFINLYHKYYIYYNLNSGPSLLSF